MLKLLADPGVTQGEKKKAMEQVIIAIVDGQSYEAGRCQVSCSTGRQRTPCQLACTSSFPV
jgi:hypothetical protein